ncbi:FKBP-type peptidyl-prolyl cis-trans isomerase [Flavobacterium sp. 5]|uniref:FKBP-type peptidyl-prolyl cis-trans isomerase n=1 Tax=Flavobacterium sp. 5 TaxID=2035199 RepID=UPI000C2C122B|nr:FKBP-type peptidyl-prolyl cis-trans isomerase [Flavobacterium sp. 5]PKB17708.1 FKBP-type peptidyl-prolyl isomerase-like protein [Flavobacterium sp. 5]
MSKIKFYFIVSMAMIAISSCNKNDDNIEITPPRDLAEQYKVDIVAIEDYLNTSYLKEVVDAPGTPEDQDVILAKIPAGETHPSLMSYLDSPTLPRLTSRIVHIGDVDYKVYTLLIREGVAGGTDPSKLTGGERPCNVDAVYAGYKGTLLDGTQFDASNSGQVQYNLDGSSTSGGVGVIRGWSEGFPQFKTGWTSSKADGTVSYNDFGVGVMFLPSAMGYYNNTQSDIPAYSPLVFSIKLYSLKRFDQDADGIPSYQEDLNNDGYMYYFATADIAKNPDDTDKDGLPDYGDFDDDGDDYATRGEIKDDKGTYYPYDGAVVDDPQTPDINESYGIPRKYTGPLKNPNLPESSTNKRTPQDSDFTDPTRLRRHLDPTCFPPYK